MVELDNKLGGAAIQHRETQAKESEMFLDYFNNKISYLEGGYESGFRHVEPSKEEPHLYRIKGHIKAGTIRMTQEPCRRDYMNSGDVFVLVAGDDSCWMWAGKESNKDEKRKGTQVAKGFCKKGHVVVLDEGVNDGLQEAKEFWQHIQSEVSVLGTLKRKVKVQEADDKDDKGQSYVPTLFLIPETLGANLKKVTRAKETTTGPTKQKLPKIKRKFLKDGDAYLLDTGFHVYIWVGEKAKASVKGLAVHHAETYFNSWKRPVLPLTVVKQGMETKRFAHYFIEGGEGCACVIM